MAEAIPLTKAIWAGEKVNYILLLIIQSCMPKFLKKKSVQEEEKPKFLNGNICLKQMNSIRILVIRLLFLESVYIHRKIVRIFKHFWGI